MSTDKGGYQVLKDAINKAWYDTYQGEAVHELTQLVNRVHYIVDDRNCWVFNAKVSDKEVKRLEEKLKSL